MAANTVIGVSMPANESLSGAVDLGSFTLVGIEVPAGWAGGATITFQTKTNIFSKAGVNPVAEDWSNVFDDTGTEVSLTVAAGRFVGIGTQTKQLALSGARLIRLRSGASGAAVNQNLSGPLLLLCKEP